MTVEQAGYRKVCISRTGEQYWYWPHPLSTTSWWLIPYRIVERASRLRESAIDQAFRDRESVNEAKDAVPILRQWKRSGVWQSRVIYMVPRHGNPTTLTGHLSRE